MFSEHYIYFENAKRYSGPFFTFQAAFNHAIRYQTDFRIEDKDKVLATWSPMTGLYKTNATYKYLVVNNSYNKTNFPNLIGKTLDQAPMGAMVQDIEVS